MLGVAMTASRLVLRVLLALGLLAEPLAAAEAQPPGKIRRIGVLSGRTLQSEHDVFRQRLRELGWVEGQNLAIDNRNAGGQLDQMAGVAAELARREPDVIVAYSAAAALAARRATGTIPIVFVLVADPIGDGLVASLAHPGGNLTGLTTMSRELGGKRLQLLREAIPNLARVALLYDPDDPGASGGIPEHQAAAKVLGLALQLFEVRSSGEIERAFAAIKQWRAQALAVPPGPFTGANQTQIDELALKARLPTMYASRLSAERGGLMAYGPDFHDLARRAAAFVDKILRGTKPADLPVEQPGKFELVINLRTAKVLGVTIPPSVQLLADVVIK
jgi:putative ABC transport system substrate-binding protein